MSPTNGASRSKESHPYGSDLDGEKERSVASLSLAQCLFHSELRSPALTVDKSNLRSEDEDARCKQGAFSRRGVLDY